MAASTSYLDAGAFPWLHEEPPPSSERVAFSVEYPVHFTSGVFSWENLTLVRAMARRDARRHDTLVIVDPGVATEHLVDDIRRYAAFHHERIRLSDLQITAQPRLDPHAFVIVVGGGSLQERVSAARARGSRVIRIPTTVTSQSTAHYPGRFALPFAVINDFDFLETLPMRDTRAGMAEAVRVALATDASLFGWLRLHAPALAACEQATLRELIRRVTRVHLADPFDPPIGLGEWAAQRLETAVDLRYGEAVAIGCALDAVHSAACGVLDTDSLESIVGTIQALALPTFHPALDAISLDLRRASLLERVGSTIETHDVDPQLLLRAIDWLRHRG